MSLDKRSLAAFAVAAGILFGLVVSPSQAQQNPLPHGVPPGTPARPGAPASQTQHPGRIVVPSSAVLVPVTVKDREGILVSGLTKDDFRIFCDNVEQVITYFSADPFPLSAVVLVDDDLSSRQADEVQRSLTAIAAGFGPNDEVALVTYDQFPHLVSDFSFNNDLLYTQLKRLDLNSHFSNIPDTGPMTAGPMINGQSQATGVPTIGATNNPVTKDMDDAIYEAGQMLRSRGRDRRKVIFIVTDGNDSRTNDHSFDETVHLLLSNDISLYSISVGHALFQKQTRRLDHYAQQTGGDTFYASKAGDLGRLYPEVSEQARNQYTLVFSPQDLHKDQDYHPIEVRVRRPDLTIIARQGFYSPGSAFKK
ncbi:MAG TPA: VWA domain-containing protein [Candidatus Acidoferrum sp.]|nr:VWA domain-containing protein [Candidatus Acidoferrum sp.]